MSARKIERSAAFPTAPAAARQTELTLAPEQVCIRKSGVEFLSATPVATWTEMTVTLQPTRGAGPLQCTGVVVSCQGNRQTGYTVSLVFTSLSQQTQARLNEIAFA